MIRKLEELGIERDENGRLPGVQFARDVAIAESRERIEQAEFRKLVKRLRSARYRKRLIERDGERYRESERIRFHATKERHVELQRARRKRRRQEESIVLQCVVCGKCWSLKPEDHRNKKKAMLCSDECWRVRRNELRRAKEIRPRANPWALVERFLQDHPHSTSKEIMAATELNPKSLPTLLTRWSKAGKVIKSGRRNARYSLPAAE